MEIFHTYSLPHPPPWCWQDIYSWSTEDTFMQGTTQHLKDISNLQSKKEILPSVVRNSEVGSFEVHKGHG